jgi:hypothetical protein
VQAHMGYLLVASAVQARRAAVGGTRTLGLLPH